VRPSSGEFLAMNWGCKSMGFSLGFQLIKTQINGISACVLRTHGPYVRTSQVGFRLGFQLIESMGFLLGMIDDVSGNENLAIKNIWRIVLLRVGKY
jgi:hypothetical protein